VNIFLLIYKLSQR